MSKVTLKDTRTTKKCDKKLKDIPEFTYFTGEVDGWANTLYYRVNDTVVSLLDGEVWDLCDSWAKDTVCYDYQVVDVELVISTPKKK